MTAKEDLFDELDDVVSLVETGSVAEAKKQVVGLTKKYNKDPEALLEIAYTLVDIEEPEEVLRVCQQALRLPCDDDLKAELLAAQGNSLMDLGDSEAALECLNEAISLDPNTGGYFTLRAAALGDLWRFSEGLRDAETAIKIQPADVLALHYLSVFNERLGKDEESRKAFKRATRHAPKNLRKQFRLSDSEFDAIVKKGIGEMPPRIRKFLNTVQVVVQDFPRESDFTEEELRDLNPWILGLFSGPTVEDSSASFGTVPSGVPDVLILYKRNLEINCLDKKTLVAEIKKTLWHEVGHFLGLEEDELEEMGLE